MARSGAVAVKGLKELVRSFDNMSKDLVDDLAMELQEAADPARKLSEQYILAGGGGFPAMSGVAASRDASYWSAMRIGVSKRQGMVWIAPVFRSNKGTVQGQILAMQYRWRMEGAVEDKSREIERSLEKWIDRLADDWGSHLAA